MALGSPIEHELARRPDSSSLSDSCFSDAEEARKWLESQRWPAGIICPHCCNFDQVKIKLMHGKSHRPGLYWCAECNQQFTVTVGTVMHRSKIPLNKWLIAMHLISASEKGASARQIRHTLGISYQGAWYISHRIRRVLGDQAAGKLGGGAQGSGPNAAASRLLVRELSMQSQSIEAGART
jgi:transposase-like protein